MIVDLENIIFIIKIKDIKNDYTVTRKHYNNKLRGKNNNINSTYFWYLWTEIMEYINLTLVKI
jgi:hypothetical protein